MKKLCLSQIYNTVPPCQHNLISDDVLEFNLAKGRPPNSGYGGSFNHFLLSELIPQIKLEGIVRGFKNSICGTPAYSLWPVRTQHSKLVCLLSVLCKMWTQNGLCASRKVTFLHNVTLEDNQDPCHRRHVFFRRP